MENTFMLALEDHFKKYSLYLDCLLYVPLAFGKDRGWNNILEDFWEYPDEVYEIFGDLFYDNEPETFKQFLAFLDEKRISGWLGKFYKKLSGYYRSKWFFSSKLEDVFIKALNWGANLEE